MISEMIRSLKQLSESGGLIVLNSEGKLETLTCNFSPPATVELIDRLQSVIDFELPEDYVNFLMISNGASLFNHPEYGGENIIYGTADLMALFEHQEEGRIDVAYIMDDHIAIDVNRYRNGEDNYLILCESMATLADGRAMYCNFDTWFYRFVVSQGNKYWYWSVEPQGK